jgi:2-alkenal reductase
VPGGIIPLGAGSGVVWDNQGHILTNNHVVENAQQLVVNFHDGTSANATVVGTDPYSDLAVLSVDVPSNQLHPITPGSIDNVKIGDLAFALGNPYGLGTSFSMGVISALGRQLPVGNGTSGFSIPSIIQTDAPINPGNSGGALVDINGDLIGIPTAIFSASGASSGVGFAIPVSIIKAEVPSLIQTGQFQHAFLGITGTSVTAGIAQQMGLSASLGGALVVDVTPNSPAAQAGLTGGNQTATINGQEIQIGGDVITAINGTQIKSMQDLISYLALNAKPGDKVTLTILRNGQTMQVPVTLASRPAELIPNTGQPGGSPQPAGVHLGVQVTEVNQQIIQQFNLPAGTQGLFVGSVLPGSPAAFAGVKQGDVITAFDGTRVTSVQELRNQLQQVEPGGSGTITILRDGQMQQLTVDFTRSSQNPSPTSQAPTSTPAPTNTPAPTSAPAAPAIDLQLLESFFGVQAKIIDNNTTAMSLSLPANTRGIYFYSVVPGSIAAMNHLQVGDVVTAVNGEDILTSRDIAQLAQSALSGQPITLTVLRNGNTIQVPLNLGF